MAKKIADPKSIADGKKKAAKPTTKKAAKPAEKSTEPVKKVTKAKTTKTAVAETLNPVEPYSLLSEFDVSLFQSGKHYKLYEKFGSHVVEHKGVVGVYFAVWAPNAQYVSVIANFNGWEKGSHPLYVRWDGSGIWEGFIPNIGVGETYKYYIKSSTGEDLEKADPFALRWEVAPHTASIVADTYYEWKDGDWMANRFRHNALNLPYSVY